MIKINRAKHAKKAKKKKNILPTRTNILFVVVFLLFSTLILRLGYTQIVRGAEFELQAANQADKTVSRSVPRGIIYDREGNVIVGNSPQRTIIYTRGEGVSVKEMIQVAENLAGMIRMDTSRLTVRDKQDFWMIRNPEEAAKLVPEEEARAIQAEGQENEQSTEEIDATIYALQLERITEEQLASLTDHDLEVLAIFAVMNSASNNTTVTILSGSASDDEEAITEEEFARVNEHIDQVPGIDAIMDWEREYPFEGTLRSVLGSVSTTEEGLPRDRLSYFLARGYSRNDRVGTSYIEESLESYLRGTAGKLEIQQDENGNIIDHVVLSEGTSGYNVITTFDIELQQKVEEILENRLWGAFAESNAARSAYIVMMNPNTGDIYAMGGKQIVTSDGQPRMIDHALGTISNAYEAGSSIKGATVLAGFQADVIGHNTVFIDRPLHIQETPVKASIENMGPVNPLTALSRSSNVFMFETIIAMGGGTYRTNQSLRLREDTLDRLRYYFNQFGLGVQTGIDLPNEAIGFIGQGRAPGLVLDFGIGQYDTYTTMQLAQYISTIANGGYRMQPQIIKAITDNDGAVIRETDPVILNRVDMSDADIRQVQRGFEMTMETGTARGSFGNAPFSSAGKTGTAEVTINGIDLNNTTMVAYAPRENPEVAVAVLIPRTRIRSVAAQTLAREAMDAFFELRNNDNTEE